MNDTINIPRAEIQAVLDAIHDARDYLDIINTQAAESKSRRLTKLFEVLRTRLAQQEEKPTPWTTDSAGRITQTPKQEEKPEPVAWMCLDDPERETAFTWKNGHCKNCGKNRIPLYTAPPKRPWQGLTDEEIRNEAKNHVFDESFFSGAIWARGKMMGKNYD